MKKVLSAFITIVIIFVVIHTVHEFKSKSNSNSQTTTSSVTNKMNEKETVDISNNENFSKANKEKTNSSNDSSDANTIGKTAKEENKGINRSNTIDANKVEDIISKKLPNGVITNLEFKNDSKNPHYEVTVIKENFKYELEISSKYGSIKEIEKEAVKTIS